MINQPPHRYFDAIDATWAPARFETSGPFRLRSGAGGGKRVSAATLTGHNANVTEVEAASAGMVEMGQDPLFMLKPGEEALDGTLAKLGFAIIDPVVLYASPAADLARHAPKGLAVIPCETPLAAQREIWETDDIGPDRIKVMERSSSPKSFIVGRYDDQISATVFVSCDGDIAMLHALTVHPRARRRGVGQRLTYGCAKWAMDQGATVLALMTTLENTAARALYEGIGMTEVSRYHYRIKLE